MKQHTPERVTDDALFDVVLFIRSEVANPIEDLTTVQKFQQAIQAERKDNAEHRERAWARIYELERQLLAEKGRRYKLESIIRENIDCPIIYAEEDEEGMSEDDLIFTVGCGEGLNVRDAIDDAILKNTIRENTNDQKELAAAETSSTEG